jgi:hypothetical protein
VTRLALLKSIRLAASILLKQYGKQLPQDVVDFLQWLRGGYEKDLRVLRGGKSRGT